MKPYTYDRTANVSLPQLTKSVLQGLAMPQGLPTEGDNVDKVSDVAARIKEHLSSCSAAVDDHDLLVAKEAARAVRDLAESLLLMLSTMDPKDG